MLQRKEWIWVIVAVTLVLVGLFSALNTLELRAEEPRRAVVAQEMYFSGDWIVPKIHGLNYYNKPPLFNWLIASCFKLTGSMDEWVVRLPALLSFLLTGLLTFFLARKYTNIKVAIAATAILFTSADLLFYGSVNSGEIDLFFTLLVFLQVASIFHFGQQRQYFALFLFSYLFTALGLLTKGLPALAFQGLTLLAYFIFQSNWKKLFHLAHFLGIFLLVGLVSAYFWAYHQSANAIAFAFNLFNEASSKSATSNYFSEIWEHLLTFLPTFLKLSLPWSLAVLLLVRQKNRNNLLGQPLVRFSILFILANVWIYWLSPGTYDRYLYPFLPFFSMFLGWLILEKINIKLTTLLLITTILAGLRITYNFTLMPYQQRTLNVLIYRDICEEILTLTENEPIHFVDNLHIYPVEYELFGQQLTKDTLVLPPILPYQIPYYLSKATGKAMRFEADLMESQASFYLAYSEYLNEFEMDKSFDVLLVFQEKWTNREMQLIKIY